MLPLSSITFSRVVKEIGINATPADTDNFNALTLGIKPQSVKK
jgi:hypothetical protein